MQADETSPELTVLGTAGTAGASARDHIITADRTRTATGTAAAVLAGTRPKQWIKNLLVFAAPGAGAALTRGAVLGRASLAFASFCLVSGAMYLANDVVDAPVDRHHPRKRRRPVASGALEPGVALVAATILAVAGLAAATALGIRFLAVMALYVALTVAYSLRLKRVAVIDIAVVASGFVLRAVAGGVATGVPNSSWFLILTSFVSLFVVAGKRASDLTPTSVTAPGRGVIEYTLPYLRYVWMMASAVSVAAYCLWAFSQGHLRGVAALGQLSTIPFVLAILRYALLLEFGRGGAPEDVLLGDRALQILVVAWLVVYGCGVYLAR